MSAATAQQQYTALGFDPAPGSLQSVTDLATNLGTVASRLGEAHQQLSSIGRSDGFWQGSAAEAFHTQVGRLPSYLKSANRSLGDASHQLQSWSMDLASMQRTAADYESRAAAALAGMQRAQSNPDLGLANQHFPDAASLQQAQVRLSAAMTAVINAETDLNTIRDQAQRLLTQHQDLARKTADALRKAMAEAPEEPGLFDRIAGAFNNLMNGVKHLAGQIWQWTKDHADGIKKVGDILSTVGTVLDVATVACAEIPVVGEVVGAAALAVNVEALAAHGLAKAAGAKVGWSTLALDAVGVIPGVGVAKSAGFAKTGTRLVKAFVKGSKYAKEAEGVEALAKGVQAAKKVVPRLAKEEFHEGVERANKILPKSMELKADSKLGVAAGITSNAVKEVATDQVKDYAEEKAEPYIENAKDAGKDLIGDLTHGKPLPSASNVFHQVLHGKTSS